MLALNGVEMAAFDTVERDMAALGLEAGVIATVVIDPQAKKDPGDKETIYDRGSDEIHERRRGLVRRERSNKAGGERKSKSAVPARETAP